MARMFEKGFFPPPTPMGPFKVIEKVISHGARFRKKRRGTRGKTFSPFPSCLKKAPSPFFLFTSPGKLPDTEKRGEKTDIKRKREKKTSGTSGKERELRKETLYISRKTCSYHDYSPNYTLPSFALNILHFASTAFWHTYLPLSTHQRISSLRRFLAVIPVGEDICHCQETNLPVEKFHECNAIF